MAQPELDRLILKNLADLDVAAWHVCTELQPAVATAMDEIAKKFVREGEWAGLADWDGKGIWFAAEDWRKPGEHTSDNYKCQFTLGQSFGQGESKDMYWLTQMLGIGDRALGLRWNRNDVKKKQWKSLVIQQQAILEKIRACGFEYQAAEGSFFLSFRVDQNALAQAAGDESLELALIPFTNALQICVNAKLHFDALLAATAAID
jgi:hypothetical protein